MVLNRFKILLGTLMVSGLLSCSSGLRKEARIDDIAKKDSFAMANATYEFENDSLSAASLKAFEMRAKQKLHDVADYIQMLSDHALDKSFRMQAKQMMLDVFWDASSMISLDTSSVLKPTKFEISNFVDDMLASRFPKLKVEISKVKTLYGLKRKDKDTYEGQLTYWQTVYRIDPTKKVKLNEHKMNANILLTRIRKTFGTSTKEIWIVFVGDTEVADAD
jgi:hypothetical protein